MLQMVRGLLCGWTEALWPHPCEFSHAGDQGLLHTPRALTEEKTGNSGATEEPQHEPCLPQGLPGHAVFEKHLPLSEQSKVPG